MFKYGTTDYELEEKGLYRVLDDITISIIRERLTEFNGSRIQAASSLHLNRTTLTEMMKRFKLMDEFPVACNCDCHRPIKPSKTEHVTIDG